VGRRLLLRISHGATQPTERLHDKFIPTARQSLSPIIRTTRIVSTAVQSTGHAEGMNSCGARALELAIAFAGVDHILAGSDYPHQIGSIPKMLESINALQISDREKAAIFGANAARLLDL